MAARVDEYMQAQTRLSNFSGSILLARQGKSLVAKGYGWANAEWEIYDTYAGEYQLAPTFTITVTREGDRLTAQATGQPRFDMFPESETKFFLRLVDAQISFVKDGSGAVTHLILHQGAMDQTGRKIK